MQIGEIKRVDGVWLKCVAKSPSSTCQGCYYEQEDQFGCMKFMKELGDCSGIDRKNNKSVIFIKVEIAKEIERVQQRIARKLNKLNEIYKKHIRGKTEVELVLKNMAKLEEYIDLGKDISEGKLQLIELKKCS